MIYTEMNGEKIPGISMTYNRKDNNWGDGTTIYWFDGFY